MATKNKVLSEPIPEGISNSPEKLKIEDSVSDNTEVSKISDDAVVINYIMLARIYDLLAIVADGLGKGEDVINIMNLHRQGQLMSPPPILQSNDEE